MTIPLWQHDYFRFEQTSVTSCFLCTNVRQKSSRWKPRARMFTGINEMDRSYSRTCALVDIVCLPYNTPSQHFSTTLLHRTPSQHFSTNLLHNTSLQHFSTTLLHSTPSQHFSTTLLHNTSLQHFLTRLPLEQFLTTLLYNISVQHFSTTLLYVQFITDNWTGPPIVLPDLPTPGVPFTLTELEQVIATIHRPRRSHQALHRDHWKSQSMFIAEWLMLESEPTTYPPNMARCMGMLASKTTYTTNQAGEPAYAGVARAILP